MTKYSSPAKKERSLKRLLTFILMKHKQTKYSNLGIQNLPEINICPPTKMLSFSLYTCVSIPPASRNLSISKIVSTNILPESFTTPFLPGLQNQQHQQPWLPSHQPSQDLCRPVRQPRLDVKDYPQHKLDDLDPDRERKRKENVETTLRMIDDALRHSR